MLRPRAARHLAAAAARAVCRTCPTQQARLPRAATCSSSSSPSSSSPLSNDPVSTQTRASSSTAAHSPPPPRRNNTDAQDAVLDAPPPSSLYDYFPTALPAGAPPSGPFAVDVPALRREFLRLQAAAHPDKQPPARKAAAEAASAAINHAYRTLADPLLRAQHILSLRGVDVAADESLRLDDSPAHPGGDGELLMIVLDAHEAIEEAEVPRHLDPLRGENDDRIRRCHDALAHAFSADDVDAAKREAVRLRYWVNIRNAIHEWEEGVKSPVLQH